MKANILKGISLTCALFNYGFMLFDGLHALISGDYVKPATGEFAGQLGPWAELVQSVGIPPESMVMKWLFILLGSAGLFIGIAFIRKTSRAWKAFLVISICSLWYLVPGTLLSIAQIISLLLFRFWK